MNLPGKQLFAKVKKAQSYQIYNKQYYSTESGVFGKKALKLTFIPEVTKVTAEIKKTCSKHSKRSRAKIVKSIRNFQTAEKMADKSPDPDQSDQSQLLDDSTIPIVDIASSVASNEETPVDENANEDLVSTTMSTTVDSLDQVPLIERSAVLSEYSQTESAEIEVVNLASDNDSDEFCCADCDGEAEAELPPPEPQPLPLPEEERNDEDSWEEQIFKSHIQPNLNGSTSRTWLKETMGGLHVLKKAVKRSNYSGCFESCPITDPEMRRAIGINRTPSPPKKSRGQSRSNSAEKPADVSPLELRQALNRLEREKQLRKIAKHEVKARQRDLEKESKRRSKAGNKRIEKAEIALGAPVAAVHPCLDAGFPHTSTPIRITLDQLRDGLRWAVQENSSFYNYNGQPNLVPGTWPDTLGISQTRRAYERNLKMAKIRYPGFALGMLKPDAFTPEVPGMRATQYLEPSPDVICDCRDGQCCWICCTNNQGCQSCWPRRPELAAEPQVDAPETAVDEDDVVIPTVEEMLANPTPSTSTSTRRPRPRPRLNPLLPTLERMRMGSLLKFGKKLFSQGAEIDAMIGEAIDDLANRRSAREILEMDPIESEIGAHRHDGAQREITRQIANLVDRLKYLNGRRSRLLETLESQQDRLDEFVNVGIDPDSFTSATNLSSCPPTGILPEPRSFWQGLERSEEQEPETEPTEPNTPSHYSSNPSEEGQCAPGDCRCEDKKCDNCGREM